MMVSDEEKRWLVVGIAMNKVAAPVLRDYIKQGMDTHYVNLDIYCSGLTKPCTLKTLTYLQVNTDPSFKHLKFQNVNNNLHLHGKHKSLYNYNINSSVDLAKLFLPDYLAEFSAFDESLDMSAILRLSGFNNPAPIFSSPNPLLSIQLSADDVRENVRNKWGHCNVTDWTEVFFNDCFSKLETLVRSLGLTGGVEKTTLDQFSDWQTKGCQLCMGHAVDQNLLSLVQQDVQDLIKNFKKTEAEQKAIQESLVQLRTEQRDMQSSMRVQLEEHDEQLNAVQDLKEQQMKENKEILEKLLSVEKTFSEELLIRVEGVEKGLAETDNKVEQLGQGFAKTDDKVEQLEQGFAKTDDKVERLGQEFAKTDDKVEQLEQGFAKTDDKVEQLERGFARVDKDVSETSDKVKQLEHEVRSQRMKESNSDASPVEPFDVKSCRSKLAEHYKRTAKVPTSVWSKTSPVDIHQIYTRLSWVKEEQTPAGSSQSELSYYTDVFTENKDGVVPKRILVQGQTGIGKSTFVKKLSVDWAELDDEKTGSEEQTSQDDKGTSSKDDEDTSSDEYEDTSSEETSSDEYEDTSSDNEHDKQKAALKKFELVLVINLKEVSKWPSLRDVVSRSHIFPEEETALVEGLLNYVTKNQEKVLLVFDGYDEYHCGSNSEIYETFRGNKLRNCCTLITTRHSKAGDLQEFRDVHAEITGFSKKDRKAFMRRMLGGEAEAKELRRHLSKKHLTGLTRVPLLLLFFCTLWKKGKLKSFPETKTKLYLAIVQYVLDYNQGKHSAARFRKVADFKEILAEIGRLALECLLKDDHVFEYDQLSHAIFCDGTRIIGLLQVTEYAENLRPAGKVSFIHKSIQEFLAAWYITYKCVPKGNLGGIEQHTRTLEDCEALENVFQFIAGLSDDGAVKVFQHFTSVRISDPTLDLSKAIPDFENETVTNVPLNDVKHLRQERFSDFVYSSFRDVCSKAELLVTCLECTGGIVPVTKQAIGFLRNVNVQELTQVIYSGVYRSYQLNFLNETHSPLYNLIEVLDWSDVLPIVIENSEVLTLEEKREFRSSNPLCWCLFSYILCFRTGQFQFYVTDLELHCDNHAKLFTKTAADSVPSLLSNLCSEQSSLKFLASLKCGKYLSEQTFLSLGSAIRNCKHLNRIEVEDCHDSIPDLLEQVPNPSKCSIEIGRGDNCLLTSDNCLLTSAAAVKLASLLPTFIVTTLGLDLSNCCSPALDVLFTSIAHKTLERLALTEINLTTTTAAALGRSLPAMVSLQKLKLTGDHGSILQAEEIEALFGGFKETLPLTKLSCSDFFVAGCLVPLIKSFRFFPDLRKLELGGFNGELNKYHFFTLVESLQFIPKLKKLSLRGKPPSQEHCCTAEINTIPSITHKSLEKLKLDGISLTPTVAAVLGRLLPEMPSLRTLKLTGENGSALQDEEIQMLFGGFSKTLPLHSLTFSNFNVSGCLAPLFKSFPFFPNLRKLNLGEFTGDFNMDERNICGLLESLRYLPKLEKLGFRGKPLTQEHCCTAGVNTISSVTHKSLEELNLDGISLTPSVAAVLGRLLPEMSSLRELELTGENESALQDEEIQMLFGGFNKTLPLHSLTFTNFNVSGCLAPLFKSFPFFPNLRKLNLGKFTGDFNMGERNMCGLLESLRFLPKLEKLGLRGKPLTQEHCCMAEINTISSVTHKSLEELNLDGISLTPLVAAVLGRLLPEMSSLRELELTGGNESALQDEEIETLFGGFNKTLPLHSLTFNSFSVSSCLTPLFKSFPFFPNLRKLNLGKFTGDFNIYERNICGLLESLRFLPNLKELSVRGKPLSQEHCCTAEINTIPNITHKSLEQLNLHGISLTPSVAAVLGRLLPEMSSLRELKLTGENESALQAAEIEVLFGGFNKTLSLHSLTFSNFIVSSCLAPLFKSFRFFPNLRELNLGEFNTDEHNMSGLLESLRFIPNLEKLSVRGKPLSQEHCCMAEINTISSVTHKSLEELNLDGISLTPSVAAVLGRLLPEMSSLRELELTGENESALQDEEIEMLFGGFNKTLPLHSLTLNSFSVSGCLAPLFKSVRFFPNLTKLNLGEISGDFNMDERNMCGLLESLRFLPNLKKLSVTGKPLSKEHCSTAEINTITSVTHKSLEELYLDGICMTPSVAVVLGRLLPEMPSLRTLKLTGENESALQDEEIQMLFGGFSKTLPLHSLTFSNFNVSGCLAPLFQKFRFFPNLRKLNLGEFFQDFNMDERNMCGLLESLRFIPNLKKLSVTGKPLSKEHFCTAEINTIPHITHKSLEELNLHGIGLTPSVAAVLGRLLPEMSSLRELELTGENESALQAEEIEVLFGGFNKTLPLHSLTFSNFSVCSCLFPLFKSFCFFPNLTKLNLRDYNMDERNMCGLLESLRFLPNLKKLSVRGKPLTQEHCCTLEINTLSNVTHKGLEDLHLDGISLTPSVAAVLGRLLPEMSSLMELELTGENESALQAEEIEVLFGGFNKTLPLHRLTFSNFSVSGCLAPLFNSFRFFPNLRELNLGEFTRDFNMDERNMCGLLESLRFIPNLEKMSVSGKPLIQEHCCTAEINTIPKITHKSLEELYLDGISLTPTVAAVLGRLLPEMSSLRVLKLTGVNGSIVQTKEMEALLGGFNKKLPLDKLIFCGFCARGCLAPLTRSLQFLPYLIYLNLRKLNITEDDLCSLLESFRFIPNLNGLDLSHNALGHAVRSIVPHISNMQKLRYLWIDQTGPQEDVNYVRDTVHEALPNLKIYT